MDMEQIGCIGHDGDCCKTREQDLKDAERYQWLKARLLGADFDWNESGTCALVFEWPKESAVSANCDRTIDDAMMGANALSQEQTRRIQIVAGATSADASLDYLWGKRDALLYRVELSALYHQKRERFFEAADKGGKAVAILGGSAALGKVLSPDVVMWAAAAITISSTLSLVFGFSDKARRHAELVRNFKQVEADLLKKGERDFCEQDLTECAARIAVLEASEPPSLATLVRICQNELACARGKAESCKKVGLMPRLLAHFFDMPLSA